MNRNIKTILIGATLALGVSLDAPAAAAQTTFRACRVPSVGVIYMIGVTGAPSACLDASHVEFSWTEGGAPADGSITTVKLANDAVTTAKILDGTIGTADLANGAITQAKLDAGVSFPPGANSVTSASIVDGAIATADIANGAVTLAKVDAATVQARVSGSCLAGNAIRDIAANGTTTCQATTGNVAGIQSTNFSTVAIASTTAVELLALAVPGSAAGLLTVAAHVTVEKPGATTGQYSFDLRVGTCAGGVIGRAYWRPPTVANTFHSTTLSVTGLATGIVSATTIVLCANKSAVEVGPDVSAYMRGLTAHW